MAAEHIGFKDDFPYLWYRGSYISDFILLCLSNVFGNRDTMRGLPSIVPLICNELIKSSNTGAQMLNSIS